MDVKPLTAADLERIHQEAWDEGHKAGHTEGYDKGYREGHEAGYQRRPHQGLEEGRRSGEAQALEETRQSVNAGLERLEVTCWGNCLSSDSAAAGQPGNGAA